MTVLAIDASGAAASCALVTEEKVLGEFLINCKINHSVTLMPLVENMLKALELDISMADYIAVSCGPGSFTGIRIGMATAKGLCRALGKKLICVPTLDVIAYGCYEKNVITVPVMDARRERVYYGIFKNGKKLAEYDADEIGNVIKKVKEFGGEAVFAGDGTKPYGEDILKAGFRIAGIGRNVQRAVCVGEIALKMTETAVDGDKAELIYLRKPQAERELEAAGQEVTFRQMEEGDIEKIAGIEQKCFAVPWSAGMIRDDYKNGLTYYIMCCKGGRVIGYGGMWHVINEGHITNIAITPEEQGKGYGGRLMDEMISLAIEKEMIGITLEVRKSNSKAIEMYEKKGFKRVGERPGYYENNKEAAVIMWKYF